MNLDVEMSRVLSKYEGGPTPESIQWYNNHKGKQCNVAGTSHIGVIDSLNENDHGLYPGSRYPIIVKITNGGSPTSFEYGIDQLKLIT